MLLGRKIFLATTELINKIKALKYVISLFHNDNDQRIKQLHNEKFFGKCIKNNCGLKYLQENH